ncbi:MAG: pseudouridine synthase [Bacteroidota bacterium]|nr:pseudouridine synthase [Bacteroidota bacterium]
MSKSSSFEKFINPKISGAKKKEAIKQEKKKVKAELRSKEDIERKQNETKYGLVTKETKKIVNLKPQDSRFKEQGSRDKIQDSRFKEQGTRFKEQGTRNKEQDSRFKKEGTGFEKRDSYKKEAPLTNYKSKEKRLPATNNEREITAAPTRILSSANQQMPLNKYVAHAGICGRREAAEMVKAGHVTVNGDVVFEPGYKVTDADKITVKGKPVHLQKNLVYLLLNKPKDFITTAKDPEGRKTVFDLVTHATKERIYPVGRLDRNTTGVLLMTNDGELAQKLTHPSFEIKKVYEVKLDKPLVKRDFDAILAGITLEDGFVQADSVGYADAKDKSVIGIEIHSGRNRIVRRLFEHLGYDVKNLDRVIFANLTKKNVDRGKWRLLNGKEVRLLKYLNQSFVRKNKDN